MREMDIALPGVYVQQPRLSQDDEGIWQLRYRGEQLKIGEKGGKTNEFHVPFPPDLVPHLEEYLHTFRPMIPNADRDPHLFLGQTGKPLNQCMIWERLAYTVYRHLGKRLYPHLFRTMWTDTYLLTSGGDVDTAAYMLNDSVNTVLKHYHEIRADQQVIKAYAFNEAILGNGKANGKRTSHTLKG
jgi:site-specific recombinase XerD